MRWGYSAACLGRFNMASSAAFARSSNPGLVGSNGKNASLSIPAASATRKNASRLRMKSSAASWLKKSLTCTNQTKSSAVSSLASPSSSVSGGKSLYAISHYLAAVGFSQRYDPAQAASLCIDANIESVGYWAIIHDALFVVIASLVNFFCADDPVQQPRFPQPNPMFGPVLHILLLIPLNLHSPQPCPVVVNRRLNGAFK